MEFSCRALGFIPPTLGFNCQAMGIISLTMAFRFQVLSLSCLALGFIFLYLPKLGFVLFVFSVSGLFPPTSRLHQTIQDRCSTNQRLTMFFMPTKIPNHNLIHSVVGFLIPTSSLVCSTSGFSCPYKGFSHSSLGLIHLPFQRILQKFYFCKMSTFTKISSTKLGS